MSERKDVCPSLFVVMATYNGGDYVGRQLESILQGDLLPDAIYVGDDGSSDDTLAIIERLAKGSAVPIHVRVNDTRLGSAANFLALLHDLPSCSKYVALADQDDIWHGDKLARAVRKLRSMGDEAPALYCARQMLVDEGGRLIRLSPDFSRRPPSFANALVENIATGCTTLINRPALELACRTGWPDVAFHDWWLYLLVSGAGGKVFFDRKPVINYRQHGGNVTGSPVSALASLKRRIKRQWQGESGDIISGNLKGLEKCNKLLKPSSRRLLHDLAQMRQGPMSRRFKALFDLPFHRQSRLDNLIFRLLFLGGRL